jgi:hypothetical protein
MKKGLLLLLAFCGSFSGRAHGVTAFPGDQDTIHLYPFVCAADGSNAADTIGTSSLQNQGGVTYSQGSGAGFCNAHSIRGSSFLIFSNFPSTNSVAGRTGTLGSTVTFLDHAPNNSFIDLGEAAINPRFHLLVFRDEVNHICIYMADAPTCSAGTYDDGTEYHFVLTYDAGGLISGPHQFVSLYDSVHGLLLTRLFNFITNTGLTGLCMGGINCDGNPGASTLLSQLFVEDRPWTDQEVQNYFDNFVGSATVIPGVPVQSNDAGESTTGPAQSTTSHQDQSAEPVSTGNGNYYYQHTDLSIQHSLYDMRSMSFPDRGAHRTSVEAP